MPDTFDDYSTGLQLSHRALLRNLDVLVREDHDRTPERQVFVTRYVDFLEVHHDAEDRDLFPVLRRHSAGRSTDVAHLTRWDTEHKTIKSLAEALRRDVSQRDPVAEHVRELRNLLQPHFDDEELALTAQHLREMVPERELRDVVRVSARANRRHALQMASFLAHSLEPDEQRAMFGRTPWIFRRVLLGWLGERRFAPLKRYAHTKELAL